jgi:hypothetical protein
VRKKAKRDIDISEAKVITFEATFGDPNTNTKCVSLTSGGGGTLRLDFPQTEVDKLVELQKKSVDGRTFKIIVDVDNVIQLNELVAAKERYYRELQLDSGAIREEFKKICKTVDVDKFSDDQIKMLDLMTDTDKKAVVIEDEEIAKILNISVRQVKLLRRGIEFKKALSEIMDFNAHYSQYKLIKRIIQGMAAGNKEEMKLASHLYGWGKEKPQVHIDVNAFGANKPEDENILKNRKDLLFGENNN